MDHIDHFNINDKLLKITQYSGRFEKKRVLSGSMMSSSLLQNFFRIKHGIIEKDSIDASMFGSLIHLGLEKLDQFEELELEKNFDFIYDKDPRWMLSCTIDLIDNKQKVITDFKVTKRYTYKKFKQDSGYAKQLRLNHYIASLASPKLKEYNLWLTMFLKDYEGNYKEKPIDMIQYLYVEKIDDNEFKTFIDDMINNLNHYLDNDLIPPEDSCNKWEFGFIQNPSGTKTPKKCKKYCSYNKICPYFKEDTRMINFDF
jgi:hypothetical protein